MCSNLCFFLITNIYIYFMLLFYFALKLRGRSLHPAARKSSSRSPGTTCASSKIGSLITHQLSVTKAFIFSLLISLRHDLPARLPHAYSRWRKIFLRDRTRFDLPSVEWSRYYSAALTQVHTTRVNSTRRRNNLYYESVVTGHYFQIFFFLILFSIFFEHMIQVFFSFTFHHVLFINR